jgi:hypothetical protein
VESPGPGRPETRLASVDAAEIDRAAAAVAWRAVLERHRTEGGLGLGVYAGDSGEYLIEAPGHGRYLVSRDGASVLCAVEGLPPENWQRALLGQVMPLAATLRGMELIHASAVSLGGRAYAFWGPSGAGKSSIAAHLIARGGVALTDDALALEATPFGVSAHPGPRRANVFDAELRTMPGKGRARLGAAVAHLDKVQLDLPIGKETPRLDTLYLLERHAGVEQFEIQELDGPDPTLLLGTAFVPYVTDAGRLRNQLEICALLAAKTSIRRLLIPVTEPAASVARRIAAEARSRPGAS